MRVLKRNGNYEPMLFDKVTERIHSVASGLNVSPDKVAQKVFSSMTDGISTSIIDEISADVAINMITEDPDYETLAVRILVSNMHRNFKGTWPEGTKAERDYDFSYFGLKTLMKMFLGPDETPQHMFMRVAKGIHGDSDPQAVQETYDYMSQKYFTHATPTLFNAGTKSPQLSSCFLTGIKDDSIAGMYDTLKDCALISKWSGGIGVHIHNVRAKGSHIRGTNGTSDGIIPMLRTFNATARHVNQCFRGDTMVLSDLGWISIERVKAGQDRVMTHDGTFKFVTKVHSRVTTEPLLRVRTKYSANSVFVTKKHRVFVRKSYDSEELEEIDANDLVPHVHEMYYPFDKSFSVVTEVTEFVNKGITVFDLTVDTNHSYVTDIGLVHNSGKRKGSFALYLEPWHADIFDFLELRLNQGEEEARTRDLFTALWIPDLFMKRLEKGQDWSLFCPDKAPGLSDVWGEDFERLYERYESEGRASKTVPIQTVWSAILKSQIETGTPYMLYKDACNRKSNQRHLGTIKSSNLCTEVVEYTDPNEIAVCNLASLCLPKFVDGDFFDYELLEKVTRIVTRNLDKVIDINMYPVPEAEFSNKKNRPVAIGVQGLADVYQMLGLEFGHGDLNAKIFETIYWASTSESVKIAEEKGPHASFEGSPWSQGLFQFDLWGTGPVTDRYDWESIRAKPIRNSLLVGPMPTATTSQIMGNNECFEPYTSNMYLRRTLAGEFVILNKHLVKELKGLGLWNKTTKDHIIRDQGSVQGLAGIPDDMKRRYRTVWEIPQKLIIDMAAERGPFVCQSQSMNLHVEDPSINKLSSMHMYAWKKGLKTGMYYLRTRPKARAIQFTLEPEAPMVCRKENGCVMCSS